MGGLVSARLAGEHGPVIVAPMLSRHAARLEQVPENALFADADIAARALRAAQSLYGVDVVFASTPSSVGWAARMAARPGSPLPTVIEEHRRGVPSPQFTDVDAVSDSPVTTAVADLVRRLKVLLPGSVDVGVVVPTAHDLSTSLGGGLSGEEADRACGAFLRAVLATEPDVVVRVGAGDRGSVVTGTCGFYRCALIDIGDQTSAGVGVLDITGERATSGETWLWVSDDEVPADTDPQAMKQVVARSREGGAG